MEFKEKYIFPFNAKIKFLFILSSLLIVGAIGCFIGSIKENNAEMIIGSIVFILFFLLSPILTIRRGLQFKKDRLKIPSEYTAAGKIDAGIEYKDIKSVEYVAKKDEGPHAKGIFFKRVLKDVDTLVIMNKQSHKYLISLQNYSKKQIKYIIEEISRRANINN